MNKEAREYGRDEALKPELKQLLNPAHSALLVIDKQKAYCDPNEVLPRLLGSDTDELQEMLPDLERFIESSRALGVPIIWTRMIEDPEQSTESVKRKMRIDNTPAISTPGTPGFEYMGTGPLEGEKEIIKKSHDAFVETELDEYLKGKGIQSLVLTGAYTSRCIASTGIGGQGRGYNVIIARDLVGVPRSMEDEEKEALKMINAVMGFVVHSSQISSAWNEDRVIVDQASVEQDLRQE